MCDWSLSPPSGLPSPVVTVRSHWLSSTLLLSTKVRSATSLPSCQLYLASVNQGPACYQSTILSALPCFCQPRSGLTPVYHPVSSTLLLSTKVRPATSLPSCQLYLASVNQGQVCYQSTILSALPCFCQPRSGLLPVYHPVSSTLLLSTKVRPDTCLPSCQLYLASVNQGLACYQSTILSALPCFCQTRSGLLPVYHPVSSTLLLSTKVRPATSLPSCQLYLASVNQGPACYQSTILSALPCFVSALPCFCQPRSGLLPVYHSVSSTLLLSTKVRPATSLPSCQLYLASVNQGPACYQSTILSALPCFCQPRSGLLPVYHPVSSTLLLSTKVRPATSLPSCQLYLASVNQGPACYQSTILSALPCFCQPRSGLLPVYHPVSSTLLLSTKVRPATSLPSHQLCLASVNQGPACYQSTMLSGLVPVYHPVSSTLLLSTKVRPATSLPSCQLYLASVNQGPACYQSTILSALPCFCQPRSGLLPVYHAVRARSMVQFYHTLGCVLPHSRINVSNLRQSVPSLELSESLNHKLRVSRVSAGGGMKSPQEPVQRENWQEEDGGGDGENISKEKMVEETQEEDGGGDGENISKEKMVEETQEEDGGGDGEDISKRKMVEETEDGGGDGKNISKRKMVEEMVRISARRRWWRIWGEYQQEEDGGGDGEDGGGDGENISKEKMVEETQEEDGGGDGENISKEKMVEETDHTRDDEMYRGEVVFSWLILRLVGHAGTAVRPSRFFQPFGSEKLGERKKDG
ncbi:hypothetical protein RRG08_053248 [Elysia crispata]|uniref:Uncharacterized protein n=1 Tax=Elysia crispata TaxID=231223 RepID=A0AAE1AN38_9GAST|nr:hypothetical protein RRG08_053248 [Elysia crispata]